MAFILTSDLQTVMIGVTFDTATTSLATQAIVDGENEIKKQLSNRYDISSSAFLTSTAAPPMLKTINTWLAQGYMYENLARGSKDTYARADRFLKKAMANLEEIRNGDVNLLDTSGSILPTADSKMQVLCNTTDYHPTFNEDSPLNWSVDSDKLDDITNDRD